MQIGSPFDALHGALGSALHLDLPDIEYWQRDWAAFRKLSKEESAKLSPTEEPGTWQKRRPRMDEVRVVMFPEIWGSTACGYGGIGGASMTPAYTVVVSYGGVSCVYFGCDRLAYRIDHRDQTPSGRGSFDNDLRSQHMAAVANSNRYD